MSKETLGRDNKYFRLNRQYCKARLVDHIPTDGGVDEIYLSEHIEPTTDFSKDAMVQIRSREPHIIAYRQLGKQRKEIPLRVGECELIPQSRLWVWTLAESGLWGFGFMVIGGAIVAIACAIERRTIERQYPGGPEPGD